MAEARFKNRGKECFGCSLANYFDLIGENSLAEKVYDNFRKHHFVTPEGGVPGLLTTRLVSDLTSRKYQGRLYLIAPYLFSSSEERLKIYFREQAPAAAEVIKEEMNAGRITLGLDEFSWGEEALLFSWGHVSLYCGKGKVVDDGEVSAIRWWNNKKRFHSSITGVLQVYRSPLEFTDLNVLLERALHALSNHQWTYNFGK